MNNVYDDIREMEEKSKKIIEDNVFLRLELEKKSQALIKLYKTGSIDESVSNLFNKLEKEDFNERIRLLHEENKILLENHQEMSVIY